MKFKIFTAETQAEAEEEAEHCLGPGASIISSVKNAKMGVLEVTAVKGSQDPDHLFDQEESVITQNSILEKLQGHKTPDAFLDTLMPVLDGTYKFLPDRGFFANPLGVVLNSLLKFGGFSMGRPLMFVGPPGAGKSVTLMKVAAEWYCQGRPLRIFTLDTLKTGAFDQLQGLAAHLEHDVTLLEAPEVYRKHLPANDDETFVFIDTPGCNPFDEQAIDHLTVAKKIMGAQVILVIPAGMDAQESMDILRAYEPLHPEAFIATKLDISHKLGNLLLLGQAINALGYTASPNMGFPVVSLNGETLSSLILEPSLAFLLNEEYSKMEEQQDEQRQMCAAGGA